MSSLILLLLAVAGAALAVGARVLRTGRRPQSGSAHHDGVPATIRAAARVPAPVPVRLRRLIGGEVPEPVIVAAGLAPAIVGPLIVRARTGGFLIGGVTGLVLALVGLPLLMLVPVLAVLGRIAPDRWVARRARQRRMTVVDALPDLLDLMVICVEAGMALDPALGLAAARLGGPLGDEVRVTLGEQSLGTPRRDAYRALAARTGSPDVGRLVAALLQAEELGTPLATALAGQADALRAVRRQAARDRAARAAPRIQLVVALVMVPGAMILVLGIMLIELATQVGTVVGGP
ncbi:MAG: type II secretion system F family protein [Thermoleophilia bacterium]|nr:type II secretion system F family protein [Thermoleophilia bacterium]